jgi:tetratricopeptide (TPR) repeat protein
VLAGYRAWQRNFDWHDDVSLWTAGVQSSPNSYKSHFSLASALFESDPAHSNIYAVIEQAEKSLTILDSVPDSRNISHVYADAASFYIVKGDMKQRRRSDGTMETSPESERAYQRSLEILMRGLSIDKSEQDRARSQSASNSPPMGYAPLYRQLARTYIRLGNFQKAFETAIFACELSPQAGEGYLVLAELFQAQSRKNDEAVALLEYFLTSKNPRILGPLQTLYQSGLDQQGCAINRTSDGVSLNQSCEVVHNDLCQASIDLIEISIGAQRQDLADQFESEGKNEFGCSLPPMP